MASNKNYLMNLRKFNIVDALQNLKGFFEDANFSN